MEQEVTFKRFWDRLFSTKEDTVNFENLSKEEFKRFSKFLKRLEGIKNLEWDLDYENKRIKIWQTKDGFRTRLDFLMLLGIMKGKEMKWIESRRKNSYNCKSKR